MSIRIVHIVLFIQLAISYHADLCFSQAVVQRPVAGISVNETGAMLPGIDYEPVFQSLSPDFEYNAVRCIFKDHKGFMWFGTESGLVRYDGINFYVYENVTGSATSLKNNAVNAITEDQNHNLWIGTSGGLNLYNREKDNFSDVPGNDDTINALNQILITVLHPDNRSLLWAGTYINGLFAYDHKNKKATRYAHDVNDPGSISSDRITCIITDLKGRIWVGTQYGLNLFMPAKGFKRFFNEPGNLNSISNNHITSLTLDRDGYIWAGTRGGGVNKVAEGSNGFNIERYDSDTRQGRLSNNYILSLFADKRGIIWIGTDNGGLNRLNVVTGSVKHFKTEEGNEYSITSNSIWSLYVDEENRLWIGTYNKGISVIDDKFSKFESFEKIRTPEKRLINNDVRGFTEDSRGNVWIATNGGGICRFDPAGRRFDRFVDNNSPSSVASNDVLDILCDPDDNLWLGTWAGGIERLNNAGRKIRNYRLINSAGTENNNVFTLYEDPNGNIWAGTAGNGLFLYDRKADEFYSFVCGNDPEMISNISYVTDMLTDSDRNFWIGTIYGLVMVKQQNNQPAYCRNFLHSNDPASLSSNVVESIFEDSKGRLWIGTTDKGLNLFNEKDSSFTVFEKEDGLPSNTIKGLLEDDEGFLWISTSKGICRFDYEKNSYRNFSSEDGLNSNEFNVRSCLRAGNGAFYFGSENGFNVFYPGRITENNSVPAVYLSELRINNKPAVIGAKDSPLKNHIMETKEITLNYRQTSFSIDFVALNYTHSSRNQFCYKLEGFDEEWNCIGTQRTANYTKIKSGKYVFKVKGSNNDGFWNEQPTELIITIRPPYWETWWAKLFYVLLISAAVLVVIKIRNERISIKNKLKLEHLAREKEHELNEANIHFFTNIAHEFRTPLNLILAPLDGLISKAELKVKEHLLVIYRNANRLLHLTNNLMDFRKLEEGRTKLKVQHGDLLQYIKEISIYFRIISKSRQIDFAVETDETSIIGRFDPEKLETILLNLLSNAYQHTPDKGRIRITANIKSKAALVDKYSDGIRDIQTNGRLVEIIVTDNGEGISPEELPSIFDKFYRGKSSEIRRNQGTGIGLTLTKGLVEIHHGYIRADSIPGIETRFSFILPIDPGAYEEKDLVPESVGTLKRNIITDPAPEPIISESAAGTEQDEEKPEILIVEDNEELRAFLVKELSTKFMVAQAHDGRAGIELAQSDIPDLIVSDIIMPNINGIELCKTIKSDVRTCHIPVILLTAKTSINEQIEGIETGADAYITKPFNIQFLGAQINQLIRSRRALYAYFSQEVYIMPNKLSERELDQKFLNDTINYIVQNITDNSLNVEGLAEHLKLSRSNVYRKIKALTGQSIIEFITLIRLKQSIKMMETSQYSLAEIAYLTGFTSPSYFTKCFKKQYGKPPSEYLSRKNIN